MSQNSSPATVRTESSVKRGGNKAGFIRTDTQLTYDLGPNWNTQQRLPLPFETSIPGVFAAGDVRLGSMKRVAAAIGEGATAVASVHTMLAGPEAGK